MSTSGRDEVQTRGHDRTWRGTPCPTRFTHRQREEGSSPYGSIRALSAMGHCTRHPGIPWVKFPPAQTPGRSLEWWRGTGPALRHKSCFYCVSMPFRSEVYESGGYRISLRLLFVFALLLPSAARAGTLESVAGWEGDNHGQGYGFLGLGALFPLSHGLTVPISLSASYLYYNYDSTGTTVSVRAPGASLMTGVRFYAPRVSATVMAGGEMRWEHHSTDAPGSPTLQRTTHGAVFQFYTEQALARRWQASEFGVYTSAARYIVSRAAVRYQITNLDWKGRTSFFLGVEGVRQGNELSDAFQAGGFAEWNLVPLRMSLGLHSGYKENWSPGEVHHRGHYFGASFYRRF